MIAVPMALILFGYWVLYAGIKKQSLADAWACKAVQDQTPTPDQPGQIIINPPGSPVSFGIDTDCSPHPGDTRVGAFIWRPQCPRGDLKSCPGWVSQLNGRFVGPCP